MQSNKKRPLFVKSKEIMQATGWDAQAMHKARKYNWITWRKDKEKGFIYDFNSIPEALVKVTQS